MHWFKILLMVIVSLGILHCFYVAGKGEHNVTRKPKNNIIEGFLHIFYLIGIYLWL